MAEYPALPLFTDAYMADTLDLTAEQHGCYLLLLMIMWRQPDCSLVSDLSILRRMLGGATIDMHGNRFNKIVPYILSRFFDLETDGKYRQKRLGKERDYLRKRSEKQRDIANKRWCKDININKIVNANALPLGNAPTPTPTPTPKESTVLSSNNFSKVYDYGSSIFPKLASSATHEITKWLEAGCSVEKDILPCIDRAKGKSIGAWVYFSGAIMDTKASREKPLPDGKVQNYKPMTTAEIDRQARKGAKTIL